MDACASDPQVKAHSEDVVYCMHPVTNILYAVCCHPHASDSPPGSSPPHTSHPEIASPLQIRDHLDPVRRSAPPLTYPWALSPPPQVSAYLDPAQGVLLLGHSRGAKLSVLAAAADSRVRALALLDPVNNTVMTPSGPGYPSALPPLR